MSKSYPRPFFSKIIPVWKAQDRWKAYTTLEWCLHAKWCKESRPKSFSHCSLIFICLCLIKKFIIFLNCMISSLITCLSDLQWHTPFGTQLGYQKLFLTSHSLNMLYSESKWQLLLIWITLLVYSFTGNQDNLEHTW